MAPRVHEPDLRDDVVEGLLVYEGIALCHHVGAKTGVLHDAHQRLPGLPRHDVVRRHHEMLQLRLGLRRLRDVDVHLVAVEVGVETFRDGQVELEGLVVADPYPHRLHARGVQSGLPV